MNTVVALERTFLGYLRTSLALSILGVSIAQLLRLEHTVTPRSRGGLSAAGEFLAAACNGVAIVVILVGAHRFWRQQIAMARGKVFAGGWELNITVVLIIIVSAGPHSRNLWPPVIELNRFRSPCSSSCWLFRPRHSNCERAGEQALEVS